jgi:hypothetical protein
LIDELSNIKHELGLPADQSSVVCSLNALDSAITTGTSKAIKL